MSEQDFLEDISFSLRSAMSEKGISQTKLAKMTGISRQLINCYVNGKRMPSLKNLLNMFFVLDLHIDDEIDMFDLIR